MYRGRNGWAVGRHLIPVVDTVMPPWPARRRGREIAALEDHFQAVVVADPASGTGHRVVAVHLRPLASLAEELVSIVPPVRAPDHFRDELGRALVDAHRQQRARRTLGTIHGPPRQSVRLPFGPASLLFVGLFLGLTVWLVRRRHHPGRGLPRSGTAG